MNDYIENKVEKEKIDFVLNRFLVNAENIDRACSTVLENSVSIFLPHKRIDKADIQKEFYKNNQILEIQSDLFDKLEIRGRLLGQVHKDILEALLTTTKIFDVKHRRFIIKSTAYGILKRIGKSTGNKAWLIQKIKEIAECRIDIYFKNTNNDDASFNFNFISSVIGINEKELIINFSPEYTYFMARNELLDYSAFVDDIIHLENSFVKSVVRYVLTNNGRNSQIRISNLIEKMQYKKIISDYEIRKNIAILKSKEIKEMLKETFGIELTNNDNTLTFHASKKHYYIKPK